MVNQYFFILGASGHAKVIYDILKSNDYSFGGFFDDNESIEHLLGFPVSGKIKESLSYKGNFIVGIGNNGIRKAIASRHNLNYVSAVHKHSIIGAEVEIGKGTVVMPGTVINASTKIGDHVIINTSASVDHDCTIGEYAHISPNVTLCGNVQVGEGSHIGAGATILPGVRVGTNCIVGGGAVVAKDVPDNQSVKGVPAR